MTTQMKHTPVKIYDGTLYDYHAGCACGVFVTAQVMRKLAALQSKHLQQVKELLLHGLEENEVFSSMWTLHYPEGKQTTVKFIDTSEYTKERIKRAVHAAAPLKLDLVFIASSMEEAEQMADAHYLETKAQAGA